MRMRRIEVKKIGLFIAAGLIMSAQAFAATATGTLNLSGTVPQKVSITVNPQAVASSLALDTTATDLLVANIVAQTNDKSGFDVTVSSLNGGNLVGSSPADALAYTLDSSPNASGGPYTAADLTGATPLLSQTSRTTGAGVTQYLFINYTGDPTLSSGENYTDTLTFTITGK